MRAAPIKAGVAYWAVVFAVGFILGTIRVLWLVPHVGEQSAVLIEGPFILGASALAAWWLTAKYRIRTAGAALTMGGLAFALLMVTELVLATTVFAMTPSEWLGSILVPPGLWGLLGQILFALMPLIAARLHSSGG